MAEDKVYNRIPLKGIGLDRVMEEFDVVFIESVNHGYDKTLSNSMFHWKLVKLFNLTGEALLAYANETNSEYTLQTWQKNVFIRNLKPSTSVAVVEQDDTFTPINHDGYNKMLSNQMIGLRTPDELAVELEIIKEKDAEQF